MKIIDQNGRVGVITERRESGLFAKPEAMATEDGNINTSTFWSLQSDGALRGLWYDSPHGAFVTAREAE